MDNFAKYPLVWRGGIYIYLFIFNIIYIYISFIVRESLSKMDWFQEDRAWWHGNIRSWTDGFQFLQKQSQRATHILTRRRSKLWQDIPWTDSCGVCQEQWRKEHQHRMTCCLDAKRKQPAGRVWWWLCQRNGGGDGGQVGLAMPSCQRMPHIAPNVARCAMNCGWKEMDGMRHRIGNSLFFPKSYSTYLEVGERILH